MTKNIITKTVNVALYDLNRLSKYKNKSEVVRKALDLFIEKEKRIKRIPISKDIIDTTIGFAIDKETLKYLNSICSNKNPDSRRFFSFSELLRVALRDFWENKNPELTEGILEMNEPETPETGDYLERNGIKIIRIA